MRILFCVRQPLSLTSVHLTGQGTNTARGIILDSITNIQLSRLINITTRNLQIPVNLMLPNPTAEPLVWKSTAS